jgi:hypothetical protein
LNHGAIPQPGQSASLPVHFALPRLATLRLYGEEAAILGLLDLIGMSSPLHNVVVRFSRPSHPNPSALARTVEKILVSYYAFQEPNHSRKTSHITISCNPEKRHITFSTRSRRLPTSNIRSDLKFRFNVICEQDMNALVMEMFPLFPLDDVRGFALEGSVISGEVCTEMFRKMQNLVHLRLDDLDLWLALEALSPSDGGMLKVVHRHHVDPLIRVQMNCSPSPSWNR